MKKINSVGDTLIYDVLETYEYYCEMNYYQKEDIKEFIYNGDSYKIAAYDFIKVCNIVDCIKGKGETI
jgi:hypothetical protein